MNTCRFLLLVGLFCALDVDRGRERGGLHQTALQAAERDCAALTTLKLPDVKVTAAEPVAADPVAAGPSASRTAASTVSSAPESNSDCCCPTRGTPSS